MIPGRRYLQATMPDRDDRRAADDWLGRWPDAMPTADELPPALPLSGARLAVLAAAIVTGVSLFTYAALLACADSAATFLGSVTQWQSVIVSSL